MGWLDGYDVPGPLADQILGFVRLSHSGLWVFRPTRIDGVEVAGYQGRAPPQRTAAVVPVPSRHVFVLVATPDPGLVSRIAAAIQVSHR